MAGFLQRLRRLLSDEPPERVDPADVRTGLEIAYQRQLAALREGRALLADVTAALRRLDLQIARVSRENDRWARLAREAVERHDDEAARAALTRRQLHLADLSALDAQRRATRGEADTIERAVEALRAKAERFRTRREAFLADAQSARAGARAEELLASAHRDSEPLDAQLASAQAAAVEAELAVLAEAAVEPSLTWTQRPRVVVLSDAVAGLDSGQAGAALARGWAAGCQVAVVPVGVGGLSLARCLSVLLRGVLSEDGHRWVVRSADTLAVGLVQPPGRAWAPESTSSDLGDWLARSLTAPASRPRRVVVDLTGLESHDAGAGLLAGLGAVADAELRHGLSGLASVTKVDLSAVRDQLSGVELIGVLRGDEDSAALLGLRGAIAARGYQARLDPAELLAAERTAGEWARLLGGSSADGPGAGAAGGAGLAVRVLGGRLIDGPGICGELAELAVTLAAADLVVTACDRFDVGNRGGPIVGRVAEWAEAAEVPCLVFAVTCELSRREMRSFGIEAAYPVPIGADQDPAEVLTSTAVRIASSWLSAARHGRLD